MWVSKLPLSFLPAGASSARRVVSVQSGPLYRTEGSHITIWCNVTGYTEGVEQHFEWSMYRHSAPLQEIKIVSTNEEKYAYAVYAQRVQNKEIYIERLSGDSVLLHIAKLELKDEGVFECYTPNTDAEYLGIYSAQTNVTVIPDTLSVVSAAQTVNKVEGDSLQLTCEVSKQTSQHSHVSVAWFLLASEQSAPQDVVNLSKDFVLRSGSPYKQRFSSGDVRLDKTSSTAYRLSIYKLQPSDQGEIYCEAAEWIQDPDRSWFAMTRKKSEKTVVNVQPTDKDFSIQLNTERRAYTAGEPLELRCNIDAQGVPDRFFSVSWVFSSSPVALVGPNAVPVLSGDYVQREAAGQLTVRKDGDSVYLLKIQRLQPEDSGKYICRVTEREKTATGDFIDKSKRSRNVQISVQPLRSNITVSVSSNSTNVIEGDAIHFTCSVRSTVDKEGSLSFSWQLVDKQGSTQDIAAVDQIGTVRPGPSYRERSSYGEIRVERVRSDTFTLSVYNTLPKDEGQYKCGVAEWVSRPDGSWEKIGEKSAGKLVTVTAVESMFSIVASSRTPSVTYNDSFDLQCIVKPRYNRLVPVSVTWRFQPANGTEFRDLVTFTRDGTLQWGGQLSGFGTRTTIDKSASSSNFRLGVSRASRRESGTYQCSAELWRKNYDGTWARVTNRTSNPLGITVMKPVSKLRVSKLDQNLELLEDSRVRLNCSITARTSPESQYTVLWYARKAGEPDAELLLKINHNSAFEYGTYAEEERLKSRVQSERLSPQLYSLTLHQAELSDSGTYYCRVHEWQLDPNNVWYQLAEETSGFTEVLVKQPDKGQDEMELVSAPVTTTVHNIYRPKTLFAEGAVSAKIIKRNVKVIPTSIALKKQYFSKPFCTIHRIISFLLHGQNRKSEMAFVAVCYAIMLHVLGKLIISRSLTQNISFYICIFISFPYFIYCSYIRLQVEESESNLTVVEMEAFRLGCSIPSQSSKDSRFSVSWYVLRAKAGAGEGPECIFSIGHDAVFGNGNCSPSEGSGPGSRLQFERPSAELYSLTVQRAGLADSGSYYCHVEEWLLNPRNAWYRLATNNSGATLVDVLERGTSLQSVICSNDSLFYFVFFYPFPIFGILLITILLVRYKARNSSKNSEGKNGAPLLWIKEPHINYSPTCLDPPTLSLHPGSVE
uniref:Immunoglobulin superfamily, member 3 n=1 Tax=Lepisosteus oculatus TaxID=7918 RepID=W5MZ99_LEPOC